ncbi:glycosyltransferase family 2 protein [Flavobacterium zepuense]|uniref:Glycosyltransferase family 2 protein n=1 Tax=Flavobacterium zepuense TaxID=2593302 RepID=A0A552UXM3_9FLAO|nr:glycosyltransferase family A protein [Flavobacterium zepuense]TRW22976.1 glycosyltransferase family 2 protein [Flavobacterium zepuense]
MAEAFKQSDIEILVATMNRQSLDFLEPMFPFGHFYNYNLLVVNQTDESALLTSPYPTVRVINAFEKGLAKSRNLALQNAEGALCVITDDDIVFKPTFADAVCNAFNLNPDATLITFRILNVVGQLYKKYPNSRQVTTTPLQRLGIMSVEMVVNLKKIKESGILFNENFGLGTQFTMGEEAVFTHELHEKNSTIVMEPAVIARHCGTDTHARVSVKQKYYVQGALFTAIFKNKYFIWVLLKLLYELKSGKVLFWQVPKAVKAALKGRKEFNTIT